MTSTVPIIPGPPIVVTGALNPQADLAALRQGQAPPDTATLLLAAQRALAHASTPTLATGEGKALLAAGLWDMAGAVLASHGVTQDQVTLVSGILVSGGAILYAGIRAWLKARLAGHAAAIVAVATP